MLRWHIESKPLQLKYTWKISRNSADIKTNLFIRVADKKHVGIGEAAPNSRYGESAEILTDQFESLVDSGLELVSPSASFWACPCRRRWQPLFRCPSWIRP